MITSPAPDAAPNILLIHRAPAHPATTATATTATTTPQEQLPAPPALMATPYPQQTQFFASSALIQLLMIATRSTTAQRTEDAGTAPTGT